MRVGILGVVHQRGEFQIPMRGNEDADERPDLLMRTRFQIPMRVI